MTDFLKERSIRYINKDFAGFKRDLIRFSQAHHSGVFQDFNESSPGMAILELQAYIGDVLSFYQDMQFNEIKHDTAQQIDNVVSFAKSLGYRPAGKRAAAGVQTFFIEVPASTQNGISSPDDVYTPILRKGAQVAGPNGVFFETLDDVFFSASNSSSPRMVTGSRFDSNTGLPSFFAIRKDVPIVAGQTKTESFTVSDFQAFKTIELTNADVIEIISVTDSSGNDWIEVDYLAQETVFDSAGNDGADGDVVPFVLKLRTVPRRFFTDRDPITAKTSLIFGSGDGVNFDDELVPNLADLALPLTGRRTFSSYAIDPQNFLRTRSLGLSPFGTTLTVKYRVGGGDQTNVAAGTIKKVAAATLDFSSTNLDAGKKGAVVSSIETMNMKKTEGGAAAETISEIKANSSAYFASQKRVVTREDYISRIMTLPAKFGKPEKIYVKRDPVNASALDIHVLTKDANGHLAQATTTLTSNIKTYISKERMLTDGVNILQSDIVNLKLEFGVVVSPKMNRTEVLTKCLSVARDYLDLGNMQIGQPIVLSDLMRELQSVFGVISVYRLQFKNMFGVMADGTTYSSVRFNVQSATKNNILYCPENGIFEIKFPTRDIVGEAK